MYELSLTAFVEQDDFDAACAVLSGFCAMPPWETVSRVLYFQGPARPTGISNQSSIDKPLRKDVAMLWKDLHQSLSRQSFFLQLRYEISKDGETGSLSTAPDLDDTPGILRWADFPDPPHAKPLLTQRKFVEIWDQRKLPSVMRDNQHRLKTETVEDAYRFFRDDMEFSLTKHYFLRSLDDHTPLETKTESAEPLVKLPALNALVSVDMQGRWLLQVRTHVLQDNKPDEIRKAQDRLMSVRDEFDGVFDFKAYDRKANDTRAAMQQQGIQALPSKVIIGKS